MAARAAQPTAKPRAKATPKPAPKAKKPKRAAPQFAEMPPMLLTVDQAAHALQLSRSKIYWLMNHDMLPYLQIGRWRRISVRALEAYAHRGVPLPQASA